MAYTIDFSLALGSSKTGLTLAAQIVNTLGANVGSEITTGFTEIGNGYYLWHCTTMPDDHRGGVKFYEDGVPGTILAFAAVNSEELEDVGAILEDTGTTLPATLTTILSRTGAFTGSGVNTILGFLKAIMSKAASTPSDVGGTFQAATDSLEALQEDIAAVTAEVDVQSTAVDFTIPRGDTWEDTSTFTGLGSLAGRSKLWLTIKGGKGDADSEAIIQIEETDKLVYLNGAAPADPVASTDGTLTVTDENAGDVTPLLKPQATYYLSPRAKLAYDVQMLTNAGAVTTLKSGYCAVSGDVTRAIS